MGEHKMKKIAKLNQTLPALMLGLAGTLFAPAAITTASLAALPALAAPSAAQLPDFADLVEKTGPAVVNIRTTEKARAQQGFPGGDDDDAQEFFRRFFGIPLPRQPQPNTPRNRRAQPQAEEEVPRGVGSGFIMSADGYVLTNAHVIDGADEVYVKLTDKREFKAKVIGLDKRTDVAVVKIEGNNLRRITDRKSVV